MTEKHKYPVTPRRAFVDLSEAVRTQGSSEKPVADVLAALANLPVTEEIRATMAVRYLRTWEAHAHAEDFRDELADIFGLLLEGLPQFHLARFIHHCVSDIAPEADAEGGGKWSYDFQNPEESMKVTIEADQPAE